MAASASSTRISHAELGISSVIETAQGRDRLGGVMMVVTLLLSVPYEFTGNVGLGLAAGATTLLGLACFAPQVRRSRHVFLAIGAALAGLAALTLADPGEALQSALGRASFIAALFTALTAIRSAAITDPGIVECGRFLAGQPPGRRYLALTLGGHLFGLVLLYGAISLLGGLATESVARERDERVRRIRTRRMLVAIQRGFISTLMWSPLTFSMAITLSVVPGASWAGALPLCAAGAVGLAGLGWALDTAFKPPPSGSPAAAPAEGGWIAHLRPLYLLLAVILLASGAIHFAADVRIFGAVMAIVPLIALVWVGLQPDAAGHRLTTSAGRARDFAIRDIPNLNGELTLLIMAGFIGTLGGAVAAPLVAASGLDLASVPTPLLLVALFWIIPLTGQIGMNPILAVSLIGPFLPAPDTLGISPALMVFAITGGWALSGATSPYTASVLLVGTYGKVSPAQVGWRWNGLYTLACGALISAVILLMTALV